ncbi:MAG: SWIM zinc finger family protein [Phycisphaerales bacterium]|nr:SWIM zinc finger family protein [Phycisphaerales bacterium]
MNKPTVSRKGKPSMKLKTSIEDLRIHTPSAWVIESIEKNFSMSRIVAGQNYAMDGQIRLLKMSEGKITSKVQCTEEKPFRLEIDVPVLSSDEWTKVAQHMAGEARIAARLSAGKVPSSLAMMMHDCGLASFADDITVRCGCKDSKPCKHAAAAMFLTAQRLLVFPLSFFEMKGTDKDDLLIKLRQARTLEAKGEARAHASVRDEDLPVLLPLEECLEDFWRCPHSPKEADRAPMPTHLPHALLRRLGISPMDGKFPMAGLLETIYDDVSSVAREQRRDS